MVKKQKSNFFINLFGDQLNDKFSLRSQPSTPVLTLVSGKKDSSMSKRSQVGVEYMMIVGFITFMIVSIFGLAVFYSDQIKDKIKLNQVENFAIQLVNSAESVFFAGEPSKATLRLYLPEGVRSLEISSDYLIIAVAVSSGENKRAYKSRVPIQGNISSGAGIKKLILEAREDYVLIS